MSNNSNTLEGITKLRRELQEKRVELQRRISTIDEQLKAVNTTLDLLGIGRFQAAVHDTLENAPALTGLTQAEAIAVLAKANHNRIRATTAKLALLRAGLIKRPKNALSIVYGVLQRREDLFRRVGPGEYELIEKEVTKPQLPTGVKITQIA